MGDNGEVVEKLFTATRENNMFKVTLESKNIPKLCTALKVLELQIENLMIATQEKQITIPLPQTSDIIKTIRRG